jgi:hypothetical protein
MLINSNTAEVSALVKRWGVQRKDEASRNRASTRLRRQLMRIAVEPILERFDGQLMLHYHRFLFMRPNGVHSFAFGSEYVSDTAYWVSVGRIDGGKLRRTPMRTRKLGCGDEAMTIRFAPMYAIPLRSECVFLAPRYAAGKHQPYFVAREKKPEEALTPPTFSIDVSALGDHLFAVTPGKHDWYTEIEIVLGTKSVHAWLKKHGSEQVFDELKKRL